MIDFKFQSISFLFFFDYFFVGKKTFKQFEENERMDLSTSLKKMALGKRMPRFLSRFCIENAVFFHKRKSCMKCHDLELEASKSLLNQRESVFCFFPLD